MTQIVLTTVGTVGDVLPFVRVGRLLKERGHEVTLIANCPFEEMARRARINFEPLDTPEMYQNFLEDGLLFNSPQGFVTVYRRHFLPNVLVELERIQALAGKYRSIVVARSTPGVGALMAGEKLGLPVVPVFLAPSFVTTQPLVEELFRSELASEINELRARAGLEPVGNWERWLASHEKGIGLWPEWFGKLNASLASSLSLCGFVLAEPEAGVNAPVIPSNLKGFLESRPVLITAGTGIFSGPEFFSLCMAACQRLGKTGLLVSQNQQQLPTVIPEGFVWSNFIPFEAIVPQLSAVVHHGGIGTVAQALAGGVPQLIIGTGGDRPDNAAHVKALGCGDYLPPSEWDVESITSKLRGILERKTAELARVAALQMEEEKGTLAACLEIEKRLEQVDRQGRTFFQMGQGETTGKEVPAGFTLESRYLSYLNRLSLTKLNLVEKFLKRDRRQRTAAVAGIRALPRAGGPSCFPLSHAQERLWFFDQLEPGSAAYNLPGAVRMRGALNVGALEEALSELVRRHEALRTTFELRGRAPVQVIHPAVAVKLAVENLEGEPPERLHELALAEGREPFDLVRGPLLRVKLLRLGSEEHVLLFTLHHIISDGWSMGVVVREFGILYEACVSGQPLALPELAIQYVDYAVWQREWLQGEVLAGQTGYWRRQLAGAPAVLELPTDRPRPAVQSHHGGVQEVRLERELVESLKELSQREGVTLFMTVMAAFKVLLHRYTGQEDLVVGTPIANRNRRETEGLIGFFVNTLALRTDLSGDPTFLELLQREREVALGAYAHQDVPFEQLVRELQPERDLGRTPLFQVMLVLQNAPGEALKLGGIELERVEWEQSSHIATVFDLIFELREMEGGLRGILGYSTDLFDASTIERMAGHWMRLVSAIARAPEQRLSELQMLSSHKNISQMIGTRTESFDEALLQ